jgi:type II pantothenate kinase
MHAMQVAIDFGLSNTDVITMDAAGNLRTAVVPSRPTLTSREVSRAIDAVGKHIHDFSRICVTGGQHRKLPDEIDGVPILKVSELDAVGRGGLYLARRTHPELTEALVVSAGSGTAMIAVRGRAYQHITGSAVGGGTLLGLGRMLIGTSDPHAINALAMQGHANAVDLTLIEATGGAIGKLPADANAVNFGRIAALDADAFAQLSREDVAAGIATLVGQVIAVIAINAAKSESLDPIVVVGHLVDLPCMRKVLQTVAGYYGVRILVPDMPGYATALGAMLSS